MGRIGAMRLNAIEDIELEMPVRLFLSLDDDGNMELEDVECDDIDNVYEKDPDNSKSIIQTKSLVQHIHQINYDIYNMLTPQNWQ